MLIQSSGLGNTPNGLGSLAIAYRIPFPLLVSLRGELGEFNPAQLQMGPRGARLPGRAAHPARDAVLGARPADDRERRAQDVFHRRRAVRDLVVGAADRLEAR